MIITIYGFTQCLLGRAGLKFPAAAESFPLPPPRGFLPSSGGSSGGVWPADTALPRPARPAVHTQSVRGGLAAENMQESATAGLAVVTRDWDSFAAFLLTQPKPGIQSG